jgi:hypothetical protein
MTTVKTSNWNKPTPKKWRDIGDAALGLCAALSAGIAAVPIPDNIKIWILPVLNLIGAAIKFLTKFTHEE